MKSRDASGESPKIRLEEALFADRVPQFHLRSVPSEGCRAELFTGDLPHIGTMQRSMPSDRTVFLMETQTLTEVPMDAGVPFPAEPEGLKTGTDPGRCGQDEAAVELFCSDSLRSIDRSVMRAQVIELILDILATTDVQSESRRRLLQHLASHPGSPEQALLCHLSENACLPPAAGPVNLPADGYLPAGGDYFAAGAGDGTNEGGNPKDGSKPKWVPAPLRSLLRRD